ncbi:hypothetical protein EV175_002653, partial [Coemansia sp. RSA 1933]
MDKLMERVANLREDEMVPYKVLLGWIKEAHDSADGELMENMVYDFCQTFLSGEGTLNSDGIIQLIDKLVSTPTANFVEKTQQGTRNINDENAAELQVVPDNSAKPSLGLQSTAALDTRRRVHSPLSRKNPLTSTAEGNRLRNRNLATMSSEDYEAKANSIQPQLLDSLTSYAQRNGLDALNRPNGSLTAKTNATSYTATGDKASYSDHHHLVSDM